MPEAEEWRMPAGDPPLSRAATASGSDDPKSTGKRAGDPAISTAVSLEGWRRYAQYWPWPRGRHGRGRGRRGMTAMEVAQSISRISGPRRGWQRPRGHKGVMPQMVEEGITQVPRPEEGGLGPPPPEPPAWEPYWETIPVKRLRVEESITGSTEEGVAVKRPRFANLGLFGPEEWGGTEETNDWPEGNRMSLENLKEPGYPLSDAYSEGEPTPLDVPMATGESRHLPVEEPVAGNADSEISLAKGGVEEPMAGKIDAEIALSKRWLPLRYPVYPSTSKFEDFLKYTDESDRIRKLNNAGYGLTKNLPTWGVESVHETKALVKFEERDISQKAGESVVTVSSIGPGHDNTGFYCSGVIISCLEDEEGTVRILTSSGVLYDDDDELHSLEQKVSVKLSNGLKYEGHVLYVNKHYNIAILKVSVGSSVVALSFGSMPRYGQRVIALGRDSMNLLLRDGFISTLERTALGRTHYMYPKSVNGFPVIGNGGPVIDEDGAMVGIMTCHVPEAAMMSISIVQICLDMWKNYSCIARPEMNMSLRTVQLLPIVILDKVRCMYSRQSGFVIDGVEHDSTPEKVGIRKGDVIEIVDENCGSTLPELETYLLSQGLRFLCKVEGLTSKELELKIRVHDLLQRSSTDTRLSIPVVYEEA